MALNILELLGLQEPAQADTGTTIDAMLGAMEKAEPRKPTLAKPKQKKAAVTTQDKKPIDLEKQLSEAENAPVKIPTDLTEGIGRQSVAEKYGDYKKKLQDKLEGLKVAETEISPRVLSSVESEQARANALVDLAHILDPRTREEVGLPPKPDYQKQIAGIDEQIANLPALAKYNLSPTARLLDLIGNVNVLKDYYDKPSVLEELQGKKTALQKAMEGSGLKSEELYKEIFKEQVVPPVTTGKVEFTKAPERQVAPRATGLTAGKKADLAVKYADKLSQYAGNVGKIKDIIQRVKLDIPATLSVVDKAAILKFMDSSSGDMTAALAASDLDSRTRDFLSTLKAAVAGTRKNDIGSQITVAEMKDFISKYGINFASTPEEIQRGILRGMREEFEKNKFRGAGYPDEVRSTVHGQSGIDLDAENMAIGELLSAGDKKSPSKGKQLLDRVNALDKKLKGNPLKK